MKGTITIYDSLDKTIRTLRGREDYLSCGLGNTEDLCEVRQLIVWLEKLGKYQENFDKYLRMIMALEALEYFGNKQDYEKYYKEVCEDVERIASSLSLIKAMNCYEKECNEAVPEVTDEVMEWLKNEIAEISRTSLTHSFGLDR